VVGAAVVFGVLEIITGLMPTYWTFMVMLVPTGMALLTMITTANATMQLGASGQMRGRVMALYMMVFFGGTPLGAPLIGWLAEQFGPRSSLWVGGAISVIATVVATALLARRQGLVIQARLRPRPHVHVLDPAVDDQAQSA
jgi:MFS family permease